MAVTKTVYFVAMLDRDRIVGGTAGPFNTLAEALLQNGSDGEGVVRSEGNKSVIMFRWRYPRWVAVPSVPAPTGSAPTATKLPVVPCESWNEPLTARAMEDFKRKFTLLSVRQGKFETQHGVLYLRYRGSRYRIGPHESKYIIGLFLRNFGEQIDDWREDAKRLDDIDRGSLLNTDEPPF